MRIALGIEYDGHEYYGWQAQEGLVTVQGCLEPALEKIAASPVKVFCAGRTDAGVHGTGQVVHFDTEAKRELHAWSLGTNTHLPPSITVRWAQLVDDHFHARFSALARRYRYIIYNHITRPAILAARVTWYYRKLDAERMQEAANYLLGEHDFSSFRSSRCEAKTPFRQVRSLTVTRQGNFITIDIEANAFLQHMVRNIAGVLMRIGSGQAEIGWAREVLEAKNRRLACETARPTGLYLSQVTYPAPYLFPEGENLPLFLLR
ncbi:MAG: tRNA pseudouridine(38-40) synthase TruA [Gammaproteobacteria bacterium]|nr:tRNA pseudouridine(38-40) synthase TruA [Gammaproteobacteria bacterium]